jgi:protein SDA1
MINLLQQYYSILSNDLRLTLVTCLKIMRGKDVVPAASVLPVFFKLFRCKDKELRKFLHGVIISDMKKLNEKAKNHSINKKMQNFVHGLLQDPNEDSSRRSLIVMIELYKRRVWNDEKTVNVIWSATMNDNPKIIVAATKFFLSLDLSYIKEDEGSEDSSDLGERIDLLRSRKGSKLTKGKKKELDRAIKQQKRKEGRKNKAPQTDFLPIDMLYDAQKSAENLFSKLKKSNDKYEVKLYMLRLVSRLIGRHRLMILSFYPHVLRYLSQHNKD